MKTAVVIWLCLSGVTLFASAQTNPIVLTVKTNLDRAGMAKQIAAAKSAAIVKLNKYFTVEKNFVEDKTTIELATPMRAEGVSITVVAWLKKGEIAPDTVTLWFASRSSSWRFLDYSRFVINYDGTKKEFKSLDVKGDIVGTRVSEQMTATFPIEEFRKITYARAVGFNLGAVLQDIEFTRGEREEWKALFDYFNILKTEREFNSGAIPPSPVQALPRTAPPPKQQSPANARYGQTPK